MSGHLLAEQRSSPYVWASELGPVASACASGGHKLGVAAPIERAITKQVSTMSLPGIRGDLGQESEAFRAGGTRRGHNDCATGRL